MYNSLLVIGLPVADVWKDLNEIGKVFMVI